MKFNKIFYGLWIFIFALFAYWQFNDPDPEVWVSIYGVAMIFCILATRGIFPKIPLTVLAIGCIVGAIYYWQGDVGRWVAQEVEQHNLSMKTQSMEESRETFGLIIILLVMLPALWKAWKG
ncbi:transmembrane 220 family protein [Algoriphagus sp. C2-6-M1]|uniref:transmembrane 220 family protein n=1 Tax=Algoriphagus persicinus TaxID=3108754 RepID=UPI002B38DEF1|nr:transmembrane 220 family protein [Algoriphagus sp. C2-6-M1]MEB2781399.1 transmembrane 220 family protein [Algoriphagus sp. C2-6-M1]